MKKDLTKIFVDEIHSSPARRNYPTNRIIYNHIDEIWSIDLMDTSDYNVSTKKGFRYIFVIIDNFSENAWCIPLKNKNAQTITDEWLRVTTVSKRKPNKIKSDRGKEFYNRIFQNFWKSKKYTTI